MTSTHPATRHGFSQEAHALGGDTAAQQLTPDCPPKARSQETVHRVRVGSDDCGSTGYVNGGRLLEWIDKVANTAATR